jgi:hypothetical protein
MRQLKDGRLLERGWRGDENQRLLVKDIAQRRGERRSKEEGVVEKSGIIYSIEGRLERRLEVGTGMAVYDGCEVAVRVFLWIYYGTEGIEDESVLFSQICCARLLGSCRRKNPPRT